ncbi:MAG: Ig-like domain-containing protein [Bacteroidota bacterium]
MLKFFYCIFYKIFILVWIANLISINVFAQDEIGGIVNNYAAVESIVSNCVLICDSTAGFKANDRVLIIQMKGALIDTVNNIGYGKINAFGNAGIYEFGSIQAVFDDTIFLQHGLIRQYDTNSKVQVVGIRNYKNLKITTEITGKPWDGKKGGIVFLEASDTITLQANVNADAIGFKGGDFSTSSDVICGFEDFYSNYESGDGGRKGESIVAYGFNDSGRGPLASGGGGGNNHNTGGGGGANYGKGGMGGKQAKGCGSSSPNVGGLGGINYAYPLSQYRLFLGSGGGGGHQNASTQTSDGESSNGGNGGGLVILSTKILQHNGNRILANGQSVTEIAENDGAGGGGAGGSVYLNVQEIETSFRIFAKGGNGGSVDNEKRLNDYHGPGGGGGGGVVFSSSANNAAIVTDLSAGESGIIFFTNHPEIVVTGGPNYEATAGEQGGIVNDLFYPEGNVKCPIVSSLRAENKSLSIIVGQEITVSLNPEDNLQEFTIEILDDPTLGEITSIADTAITYQSPTDNIGLDSIEYLICTVEEPIACNNAWVYIEIIADNRIIDAVDDIVEIIENSVDLSINDVTDAPVTYQIVLPPKNGSYQLSDNGILDYQPNVGFENPDTLTYAICTVDLPEKCDTATVFINTNLTNIPPLAVNDTILAEKDQPIILLPLVNDTDFDGDSLKLVSFSQPAQGSVSLENGQLIFIPEPGFTGMTSFEYTIEDTGNPSYNSVATITIEVIENIVLTIPSGISPNGDFINDFFVIEDLQLVPENTLRIFNRWGEEVYNASPYLNNWDGRNQQGAILPDGTYFYVLSAKNIKNTFSGYVIIHR